MVFYGIGLTDVSECYKLFIEVYGFRRVGKFEAVSKIKNVTRNATWFEHPITKDLLLPDEVVMSILRGEVVKTNTGAESSLGE